METRNGNRTHPSRSKSNVCLKQGNAQGTLNQAAKTTGAEARFRQTMASPSRIHVPISHPVDHHDGASVVLYRCRCCSQPMETSCRSLDCAAPPRSHTCQAAPLLGCTCMTPREQWLREARRAGGGPVCVHPGVDEYPAPPTNMIQRWRDALENDNDPIVRDPAILRVLAVVGILPGIIPAAGPATNSTSEAVEIAQVASTNSKAQEEDRRDNRAVPLISARLSLAAMSTTGAVIPAISILAKLG